jgi:hypothetical protein
VTASTAAILCSITGGCLELAGLVTVVRGIAEDRRQAKGLFEPSPLPGQLPPPSPRTSATQLSRGHRMGMASAADMARRQYESEAAIVNAISRLTDQVNTGFHDLTTKLRDEMAESDSSLRERLRYVLGESVRGRTLGAVLLGLGILFAMAGSVLSTAS